jgi:hypothetical protein
VGKNLLLPVELKNKINLDGLTVKGKIKYFNDNKVFN